MAKNKIQHYVPRCHLRPFSLNGEGKAICLLNLKTGQLVENAPLRHQCARDYYYGPDGKLETTFQPLESHYATLVRQLPISPKRMPDVELDFLRDFALLQSLRTQTAHERLAVLDTAINELVAKKSPQLLADVALDEKSIIHRSLSGFGHFREVIEDLRTCIVLNQSTTPFVTSDDPAIQTNRFHLQRLKRNNFGLGSSGALLLMPLTLQHLMISYDPHTYMLPDIKGSVVTTNNSSDIQALNALQHIRTGSNIFFGDWGRRNVIVSDAEAAKPYRPEKWNNVLFLIEDGTTANGIKYRVGTEAELLSAKKTVTVNQAVFPNPPIWFSKLKWHPKPRTIETGSAAGVLRPTTKARFR